MSANTAPIYSRIGDIDGTTVILTAATGDYTGQALNNTLAYLADANGSYVYKLRFKAVGTNIATVARIYINSGGGSFKAAAISAVSGTPTGTPSGTGGTLLAGSFFAKIFAVDQYGSVTAASTESAAVVVTGSTGSIAWAWTAVTGAASYIIYVGLATNNQQAIFTSTTNSYTQTIAGTQAEGDITNNNYLFGEVSLPAITATATAATVDIDYPMGIALGANQAIIIGLATTVASGWIITTVAGKY